MNPIETLFTTTPSSQLFSDLTQTSSVEVQANESSDSNSIEVTTSQDRFITILL